MRQKIKMAQALAHEPDVLFLDEPFNGMDPPSRRESLELIQALGEEGRTVMVSSHILHEVEDMTSRILLINRGRILAEGDIPEIRDALERQPHRIQIRCEDARGLAARLIEMENVQGVQVSSEGGVLVQSDLPRDLYRRLPELAMRDGQRIHGWQTLDDNLKSLFEYLVEEGR
jgi:ABC-2 type transport system ATP-binding protein